MRALVPSVDALSSAMIRLAAINSERGWLRSLAQNQIENCYSMVEIARRYLVLYRK
jgi:hypothetical protein